MDVFTSDKLASPLELGLPNSVVDADFPSGATITEVNALVDVETSLAYRLVWWLVTDGMAILAIPFLVILRRMLAKGSEPFTPENASRLQWLAGLAVAFACVDVLRPVVSMAIQNAKGFDGFGVSWDVGSLFAALLLAALLEVWRHGVAIRTEQELTI